MGELEGASALLAAEAERVRAAMGHGELPAAELAALAGGLAAEIIFVPGQGRYARAASATSDDRLASLQVRSPGVVGVARPARPPQFLCVATGAAARLCCQRPSACPHPSSHAASHAASQSTPIHASTVLQPQAEFEAVRKEMEKEARRAAKLEGKAQVLCGGLAGRHAKLAAEAEATGAEAHAAEVELACFRCAQLIHGQLKGI